jgi:hypothetical protein
MARKPHRKDEEFEEFIKILEGDESEQGGNTVVAHWREIAESLGINKDTITKWKDDPRAIEARKKGIREALFKMQYAGAKDWKMWESKLKMLGVSPIEKSEDKMQIEEIIITRGYQDKHDEGNG